MTVGLDGARVGDQLPQLVVPVTRTQIISGAIASRDYQDVHHDPVLAGERGSPDIFMNILTTNGLVGRYVTDWSGPEGVLEAVSIRLGVPAYPGDTLRFTGRVAEVDSGQGSGSPGNRIIVEIEGVNDRGIHVSGRVQLSIPGTVRIEEGQT